MNQVKELLRSPRQRIRGAMWVQNARRLHASEIRRIRLRPLGVPLRVIFLVEFSSAWKAEPVLRAMLDSPRYDPIVVIVPILGRPSVCRAEFDRAVRYVQQRSYPYQIMAGSGDREALETLDALKPDLIFFSNPHRLVPSGAYDGAFKRWLSCYVPYSHQVSKYGDFRPQYNQEFHNWMWRIFSPHIDDLSIFREHSYAKGANVIVTGYPPCEIFAQAGLRSSHKSSSARTQRRIIWAPHHTVSMPDLPYSNFLQLAEPMRELVRRLGDTVSWTFKPHPLLMDALQRNEEWGGARTQDYYQWWASQSNTHLALGAYEDLFIESDAMIHDCGSFLAEYLYLNRPVMFVWATSGMPEFFNKFGQAALLACEAGHSISDIESFVKRVINCEDRAKSRREDFIQKNLMHLSAPTPTQRIISAIESELF